MTPFSLNTQNTNTAWLSSALFYHAITVHLYSSPKRALAGDAQLKTNVVKKRRRPHKRKEEREREHIQRAHLVTKRLFTSSSFVRLTGSFMKSHTSDRNMLSSRNASSPPRQRSRKNRTSCFRVFRVLVKPEAVAGEGRGGGAAQFSLSVRMETFTCSARILTAGRAVKQPSRCMSRGDSSRA